MPKNPKKPDGYSSSLERYPKIVRAIGMVTIEHAALEMYLAELLGAVLGIGFGLGDTLYFTPKSTIARVQLISNTVEDVLNHDEPLLHRVRGILKRCNAVMGKRHDIMHAIWGQPDSPHDRVFQMSMPRGDIKLITLTNLTDIIRDQRNLVEEIGPLIDEVQSSVSRRSSQNKSPEQDHRDKPE